MVRSCGSMRALRCWMKPESAGSHLFEVHWCSVGALWLSFQRGGVWINLHFWFRTGIKKYWTFYKYTEVLLCNRLAETCGRGCNFCKTTHFTLWLCTSSSSHAGMFVHHDTNLSLIAIRKLWYFLNTCSGAVLCAAKGYNLSSTETRFFFFSLKFIKTKKRYGLLYLTYFGAHCQLPRRVVVLWQWCVLSASVSVSVTPAAYIARCVLAGQGPVDGVHATPAAPRNASR